MKLNPSNEWTWRLIIKSNPLNELNWCLIIELNPSNLRKLTFRYPVEPHRLTLKLKLETLKQQNWIIAAEMRTNDSVHRVGATLGVKGHHSTRQEEWNRSENHHEGKPIKPKVDISWRILHGAGNTHKRKTWSTLTPNTNNSNQPIKYLTDN